MKSAKCVNEVYLIGTIETNPVLNSEYNGVRYYRFLLRSNRKNGDYDMIPITVDDRDQDTLNKIIAGNTIEIKGVFRSTNTKKENQKKALKMYIYAKEIAEVDANTKHINNVYITGYIIKPVIFRNTPKTKTPISDIIIAINRNNSKSDYMVCIAWNNTAKISKKMRVGDKIRLVGRFQSREYMKQLDINTVESRTAYEISIGYMDRENDKFNKNVNVPITDINIGSYHTDAKN